MYVHVVWSIPVASPFRIEFMTEHVICTSLPNMSSVMTNTGSVETTVSLMNHSYAEISGFEFEETEIVASTAKTPPQGVNSVSLGESTRNNKKSNSFLNSQFYVIF